MSENCAETHPSYRLAPTGRAPSTSQECRYFYCGALQIFWFAIEAIRCILFGPREGKMQIPVKAGGGMKTTGLQTARFAGGQVPRPAWLPAKWNALVTQSIHAPMALRTGVSDLISHPSPKLSGGKILPLGTPTTPSLWVEKGVIWQLPNLLIGFTDYSAATTFFSSVKSLGYMSAPSSWYAGSPFSATDFPILHFGKKGLTISGFILVWPSLNAASFASTFLSMLPVKQPLIPSIAPTAGPVASTSAMSNFTADSPTGVQTFQAQYIMYAPWGPNPQGGMGTSNTGIVYDMIMYSWWYDF